ncbi:MAG: signal recognition particle-docking protein FtsY [Termitinemataceae bacterium]|nr:MAG: signal recognition particle-docking protein FtsY [Termitinemataceae bacterium]
MKTTWTDKLKSFFVQSTLSQDFFDDLCDLLVEGDFGAAMAMETTNLLHEKCKKEKVTDAAGVKTVLCNMLLEMLAGCGSYAVKQPLAPSLNVPDALNVILLLGVNGVGKTTSCAKLAALCEKTGKTILAASDTFRAAAVDQLKIHGERLNIRVVAHKTGGDPAAVVYDSLDAAQAGKYQFVIIDTAGRMHTKTALVDELKKIDRVVLSKYDSRQSGECQLNYKKILVLDSTTGSNATAQTENFNAAVKIDGVILTKFDSLAKGGIVFSLVKTFNIPVLYVCTGEKYEDIKPFNAADFVKEFLA